MCFLPILFAVRSSAPPLTHLARARCPLGPQSCLFIALVVWQHQKHSEKYWISHRKACGLTVLGHGYCDGKHCPRASRQRDRARGPLVTASRPLAEPRDGLRSSVPHACPNRERDPRRHADSRCTQRPDHLARYTERNVVRPIQPAWLFLGDYYCHSAKPISLSASPSFTFSGRRAS